MRRKSLVLLALVIAALTLARPATSLKHTTVPQDNENREAHPLSLTLSTDKQTYEPHEPIHFTLTLRNVSSNGLWVGSYIGFADVPGAFAMTVTDERGNQLHGEMVYFAGSLGDFKREDLSDWVRKTRLVLCPGCFLGMTATLQDYRYDLSKSGKYRLQASYSDIGYKEIQEEGATRKQIEKARKQSMFPLWSGSIKSPELWVEIMP